MSLFQKRPLWLKILLCLLLAMGLGVVCYVVRKKGYQDLMNLELDAIRKAGQPITPQELDAWYPSVPDEDNAARWYEKAFPQFARIDEKSSERLPLIGTGEWPPRREPLSPELIRDIEKYLSSNKAAMSLLAEGGSRNRCRYSLNIQKGLDYTVIWPTARTAIESLLLQAMLFVERGESRQALASIDLAVRLSTTLTQVPFMCYADSGNRCLLDAQDMLERVMSRFSLSPEDLDRVLDTWVLLPDLRQMQRVFAGDRCWGLLAFDDVLQQVQSKSPGQSSFYRLLFWEKDKLEYLKLMKRVVHLGDETLSFSERAKEWSMACNDAEKLSGRHILTKMLFPAAGWHVVAEFNVLARRRAIQAAVAVERDRLAKGSLPAELEDIIPEFLDAMPQDPFNEGPLLYKKLAKGYVIYCARKDVSFTVER